MKGQVNPKQMMYIGAAVIVVIAILILFAPPPVASGDCDMVCSESSVTLSYEDIQGYIDSSMCGTGHDICCIKKLEENVVMDGYTLTCVCCDCSGSAQAGLGTCNYPLGVVLNPLGDMLGLCRLSA